MTGDPTPGAAVPASPGSTAVADFRLLPDVASRALGAAVLYANDEFYADSHNLIDPRPPAHDPAAFGARGKIYDGWETRRRREPGEDFVIIRLAAPAIVRGVTIDTAHFRGNYPPFASIDGATMLGYPTAAEVRVAAWTPLAGKTDLGGDRANLLPVTAPDRLVTHLRLTIYPDGGVARLRVFGEVVPDPRRLGGRVRPGRDVRRRPGGGLQQHVLLLAGQRAGAGAGSGHVGRLGDRTTPRQRARLAGGAPRGAGRAAPRGDRHEPFRRQRTRSRPAQRCGNRRGTAAPDPAGPGHRAPIPDPGGEHPHGRHSRGNTGTGGTGTGGTGTAAHSRGDTAPARDRRRWRPTPGGWTAGSTWPATGARRHRGRACSNMFFSSPANALAPGRAQVMSDGWETARRRDDGHDWLVVRLAVPGVLHHAVIDTSRFAGNAPGHARLSDAETGAELLPRTRLVPDTEHRFRIPAGNTATGEHRHGLDRDRAGPAGHLPRRRHLAAAADGRGAAGAPRRGRPALARPAARRRGRRRGPG